MENIDYIELLKSRGLRVTPQRLLVLETLMNLNDHPGAEEIARAIQKEHPNIALGTVYKTLEVLVEHGIVAKVKTEKDQMRYDAVLAQHHHLYCVDSDRIEDYYDEDLNRMLNDYFQKKKIEDFSIYDIKLQISGKFKNLKNK